MAAIENHVLLGLLDYLFSPQTLPENRFIFIEGSTSIAPLIVWAHFILGLSVRVCNMPHEVYFGAQPASVTIKWDNEAMTFKYGLFVSSELPTTESLISRSIGLLDQRHAIVLQETAPLSQLFPIECSERIPLKGYGSVHIHCILSTNRIVHAGHPICKLLVKHSPAAAVSASQKTTQNPLEGFDEHIRCGIEIWRIMEVDELLFRGQDINWREVERCAAETFADVRVGEDLVARTEAVIEKNPIYKTDADDVDLNVSDLAVMILCFACVTNIADCAELPLRYLFGLESTILDTDRPTTIPWYNRICQLLTSDYLAESDTN